MGVVLPVGRAGSARNKRCSPLSAHACPWPPAGDHARARAQAFLKVYGTLRDEIVDDVLFKGQPADAKSWMREVRRSGQARWRLRAAGCSQHQAGRAHVRPCLRV